MSTVMISTSRRENLALMVNIIAGALVQWNDQPYCGTLAIGIINDLVLCSPAARLGEHSAWLNWIIADHFIDGNDVVLFVT